MVLQEQKMTTGGLKLIKKSTINQKDKMQLGLLKSKN